MEELVGAAVRQTVHRLDRRRVLCELPDDLPMMLLDGQLIRQLLSDLLENAVKYTPRTQLVVAATPLGRLVAFRKARTTAIRSSLLLGF